MARSNSSTPVILLAFANDATAALRELALEQDALSEVLEQAQREGKCQLIALAAATPDKIIKTFQKYKDRICIFHYGGHSDQESLFLRKDFPGQNNTKASQLAEFLGTQDNLECIFINGCLSAGQAEAYQRGGAKAIILTDRAIGDQAAREFAQLFYRSLAHGATISKSFRDAETGYRTKQGDIPRGLALQEGDMEIPWRLFPEDTHGWRLPLLAKYLTRIPTLDLEKEFIGRGNDLQRLAELIDHTPHVALVNGLGGIGKTVLATAYVQTHIGEYDHLVWINRGEDLIEAFALHAELAEKLGLAFEKEEDSNDRFGRILRTLQQLPGRNLLVIDNAQEQTASQAIRAQLPGPPYWRVLLTSRLDLAGYDRMRLDELTPEAAKLLFRTHFQGVHTETDLEELLAEIGYHTLSTELLARLLEKLNNILSVSELTAILRQKQLDDSDLQEKVWARHSGEERGIYLHLMKAFELSNLNEQEKGLLQQFVVLPVEPYPVSKLADLLQQKPLRLNKVLNSLATKGWLTLHEDKTFSIHRLIRQVTEYQLPPEISDVETLLECMILKMNADAWTSLIAATFPWISYALAVENYFTTKEHERLAVLQNNIAETYRALGQYEQALGYHQKAQAIRESVLEGNHPDLALSYNNIAGTYRDLGQYKQALGYHQKAQAIRESVLESNHPDLASSYNNIALTYSDLGQYEQALAYHQKDLVIKESVLEANHPDLAISYNNIALTYLGLRQYELALGYHQKDLAIKKSVLESNHPDLAISYNNIAETYRNLGQYDEVLRYLEKALVIRESVLEENHPYLAISYNNIAFTYSDLRQYMMRLCVTMEKNLAIKESVLEGNHSDLASSYNNIAGTYRDLEQYVQALAYLEKALVIRESVLEANHPDLATSYNNIALTYRDLGQYKKALTYHQKALAIWELVLEANHPYIANSYHNIAETYRDLGQKAKAAEYEAKAAAIRENRTDG